MPQQSVKTVIIRLNARHYSIVLALVVWFAIGKILFYVFDFFSIDPKHEFKLINDLYYVWDGMKDVLMLLAACTVSTWFFKSFWPLLLFTIIRFFLLVLLATMPGFINIDMPFYSAVLFLVCTTATLFFATKNLFQWKRNSY